MLGSIREKVCTVMAFATMMLMFIIPVASAVETVLAEGGKSLHPVVISEAASPEVVELARELASYLEKISGVAFSVEPGDGSSGIAVGGYADFPELGLGGKFDSGDPMRRDEYLIRSHQEGLYLIGATDLAAQHAVWDLLYQFGYRYFFPTQAWEIVPELDILSVAEDRYERPDYLSRRGPRGAPRMSRQPWAQEGWRRWQARNRTNSGFGLHTGHVYGRVIRANREAFDENPEYWGLVGGERTSRAQPNVAHPDVQQMFIDYSLNTLRNNPERDSVSMDPRDENPWSESEESRSIGRPSEQAVFIANKVAEAVTGEFGEDKYVGIYAYGHHSPPPRIDVHPNVIVSLATAGMYIRGGYTLDGMLHGWAERANMLGIRDYYSLTVWRGFLPARGNVTSLSYVRDKLPEYYEMGARFMNAESDNSWGGSGLGYYLSSRILWDVSEAERLDELIDDFLDKCFGPASVPMRRFYELIDRDARDPYVPERAQPLNDDMIHRMYHSLAEARDLAEGRDDIIARIDDLILYTRFVDLYRVMNSTRGESRQQTFDDLVSFTWRIRERLMVPSVNMLAHLNRFFVNRDDNLSWPEGGGRFSPAVIHREREDEPFRAEEIAIILNQGMAAHEPLDMEFVPSDYDVSRLVPAGLQPVSEEEREGPYRPWSGNRGRLHLYLWTDNGQLPRFWFSAGHIYNNRGPLRWELSDSAGVILRAGEVPPENPSKEGWHGQEGTEMVDLEAPAAGLYRLVVSNTGQGYFWDYEPRGAKLSIRADLEEPLSRTWLNRHYFYVPEGREKIVIAGTLTPGRHWWHPGIDADPIDPEQIRVEQGFTEIPVPQGSDGTVWMLRVRTRWPALRFLNIPGFLAYCPSELLLPEDFADEIADRP